MLMQIHPGLPAQNALVRCVALEVASRIIAPAVRAKELAAAAHPQVKAKQW
jgi:hypothetical protein